ncbi:hypothetical protein G9A89_000387 [Geosiphon pyriformis]|nr:hypothetical protein G9A89_000387 [Geosiphon pyriformis]
MDGIWCSLWWYVVLLYYRCILWRSGIFEIGRVVVEIPWDITVWYLGMYGRSIGGIIVWTDSVWGMDWLWYLGYSWGILRMECQNSRYGEVAFGTWVGIDPVIYGWLPHQWWMGIGRCLLPWCGWCLLHKLWVVAYCYLVIGVLGAYGPGIDPVLCMGHMLMCGWVVEGYTLDTIGSDHTRFVFACVGPGNLCARRDMCGWVVWVVVVYQYLDRAPVGLMRLE